MESNNSAGKEEIINLLYKVDRKLFAIGYDSTHEVVMDLRKAIDGISSQPLSPQSSVGVEEMANKIVNTINEKYNLNLLTVDSFAMSEDIYNLLGGDWRRERCPKGVNPARQSCHSILKEAMSEPYCGKARFDFLDDEELPMIYEAMTEYSSLMNKEKDEKCAADHLSIDELLKEFTRRGFNTENWDGDEGAEKAIVDGVCRDKEEWSEKLFDKQADDQVKINQLQQTLKEKDEKIKWNIEIFMEWVQNELKLEGYEHKQIINKIETIFK